MADTTGCIVSMLQDFEERSLQNKGKVILTQKGARIPRTKTILLGPPSPIGPMNPIRCSSSSIYAALVYTAASYMLTIIKEAGTRFYHS